MAWKYLLNTKNIHLISIYFDDVNCFGLFDRSWKNHKLQLERWTWQFRRTVREKKINCSTTTICGLWFLSFWLVAKNYFSADDRLNDKTKKKDRTKKTLDGDANKTAFIVIFTSFAFYNVTCVCMRDGRADVRINIWLMWI